MNPSSIIPVSQQCTYLDCGKLRREGYNLCADHAPPEVRCPLTFKSIECGHIDSLQGPGVGSCDKTPETCKRLGNFERFGGSPGIPKPAPEPDQSAAGWCEAFGCHEMNRPTMRVFPKLCEEHANKKLQRQLSGISKTAGVGEHELARGPDGGVVLATEPTHGYCAAAGCASYNRPEVGPGNQWNLCEKHAIELRTRAATGKPETPVVHAQGTEPEMVVSGDCEVAGCTRPWRPWTDVFPLLCERHSIEAHRQEIEMTEARATVEDVPPLPAKPTGAELVERVRTFVHARVARGHDRECTRTILMLLLAGSGDEWPGNRVEAACDCGLREAREILEP